MAQVSDSNAGIVSAAASGSRSTNQTPVTADTSVAKESESVPTKQHVQVEVEDRTQRSQEAVELTNKTISPERLADLVHKLQEAMPATENTLQFRIDDILGRAVVSVIDENSGEIIRQLPSDEVVRAAHNIEYMRGVLFDRRS